MTEGLHKRLGGNRGLNFKRRRQKNPIAQAWERLTSEEKEDIWHWDFNKFRRHYAKTPR